MFTSQQLELQTVSSSPARTLSDPDIEKLESDDDTFHPPPDEQDLSQQLTKPDNENPRSSLTTSQSCVEHPSNPFREFAFVAVLCMSQLMTQAGLAQVVVPLHIIGDSFGTKIPGQLSWFPAAYSLTVGTFILPAGRLGDLYGHKKIFIIGFLWWGLWSMIAGFAVYSGVILFSVCRAFQGIGPALCLPNAVAILGRAYKPGVKKGMVFSAFGATAPSGFVVGAVFSSLLAEFAWWPWSFWITAIVCVLLAGLGFLLIPHTPPPFLDNTETTWNRIDGWGGFSGVAGLVLFNFAWNQAPIAGWGNPYIYTLLIVSLLILGLFGYIELCVSKFPLVPFRDMAADSVFILACMFLGWASFGIWTYYFWQIIQELRHISPLLATAWFSPVAISGLFAAITSGYIIHRVPGSLVMGIAMTSFTVGSILVATMPVDQVYWAQSFVAILIMPWGMDLSFPAANLLLSNKMPREAQGVSASLVNTIINYSISLALGIAGTIEGHVNHGGADPLLGYRGAMYLGVGMSAMGMVVSGVFTVHEWRIAKRG